ncbi:MAG TPA: YfiR family protein [Bryobacteraceae bacterium]|nr:YfiR family protein [Bryobacteraceae bacterium]
MRNPLAFVALAVALSRAVGADAPAEEYHVKGAFLLNFAKFVEWPGQAFKAPGDPISICVLGGNPFTPALEQAAQLVVVEKRAVKVRQVQETQQARQCQIVFVSVSERKRTRALLEAVKGGSVLTVGESEGFIASGGVIEFRMEDSKVKIDISAEAAKRAGLHISAKLLSLAQSGKSKTNKK